MKETNVNYHSVNKMLAADDHQYYVRVVEKIVTMATVNCNTFDCGFLKYSTWLGKCFSLH